MAQPTTTCKECGWSCKSCEDQTTLHLHVEIENLKQRLLEREHHIVTMETNFLAEADKFPNGEYAALTEELVMWQEKYSRLYESYKRVQKVNQNLEDKLLKIVDKCETEKNSLLREVSSLTQRLVDARGKGNRLQSENERYRNDVNLAIQLLQCKPANFVSQKYDSLPADLQQKVLSYVCGRRRTSDGSAVPIRLEMRTIKVPVSTSPPSAMVYSVNKTPPGENEENCEETLSDGSKPPIDSVSAAIMAKVLEERERERQQMKHCESCTCTTQLMPPTTDQATQTSDIPLDEYSRTIVDATNRGSQGLVRYVDVVATRNSDSSSRDINQSESAPLIAPSNRLGVRIGDNATRNVTRSGIHTGKHSDSIECQSTNSSDIGYSIVAKSNVESGYKYNEDCTSKNCKSFKETSKQNSDFDNSDLKLSVGLGSKAQVALTEENGSFESEKHLEVTNSNESGSLKLKNGESNKVSHESLRTNGGNTSPGSSKESCIIDVEVSADGRSDISSSVRSKEIMSARNSGETQNKVTIYHAKSSSEGSIMKIRNREGRSFLAENSNNRTASTASSWVRYPSESNKKPTLVTAMPPNEKPVSQVPLPGIVKPTETSISRLPFSNPSRSRERGVDGSGVPGPRLCSMRVQAGTSNILLDNATSYEPVLYTSRHSQQDGVEAWGVGASRSGAAVLVHAPRSRSTSASSMDDTQHKQIAVNHLLRCHPK